tara:strand:- start:179 stop:442 length:264 start_codon:yes stop_codon:yes gene_type:complete
MKKKKKEKVTISEGTKGMAIGGLSGNRVMAYVGKLIPLEGYANIRVEYGEGMVIPDGESRKKYRRIIKKRVIRELKELIETVEDAIT